MWRLWLSVLLTGVLLRPVPAQAWGFDAHKFVMARAIALLPDAIRPLFEQHRDMLVERSIDPDTWRTAGFAEESPHHFLDIDATGYGPYPFRGLPRDYRAAVAKFGADTVNKNGTLPWRVEEYYGNLRRAFQAHGSRPGSLTRFEVLFFSATLGHYVADAHVPFHAVTDYDGVRTKQRGIHARFESVSFERFRSRLTIAVRPSTPITAPRDFAFDTLIEGTRLVPPILAADRAAIGEKTTYDDAYYDAFFSRIRPVMERRLAESIAGVAAAITGAWEAAGRPIVTANPLPEAPRSRSR